MERCAALVKKKKGQTHSFCVLNAVLGSLAPLAAVGYQLPGLPAPCHKIAVEASEAFHELLTQKKVPHFFFF